MKFELEASPDELDEKGEDLLRSLYELLKYSAPDTADLLEKALQTKEQELRTPVLRTIQRKTKDTYNKSCIKLVAQIIQILGDDLTDLDKDK